MMHDVFSLVCELLEHAYLLAGLIAIVEIIPRMLVRALHGHRPI